MLQLISHSAARAHAWQTQSLLESATCSASAAFTHKIHIQITTLAQSGQSRDRAASTDGNFGASGKQLVSTRETHEQHAANSVTQITSHAMLLSAHTSRDLASTCDGTITAAVRAVPAASAPCNPLNNLLELPEFWFWCRMHIWIAGP